MLPRLRAGIVLAISLALGIGAVLTFCAHTLTFDGEEALEGTLSLLTVAMVT